MMLNMMLVVVHATCQVAVVNTMTDPPRARLSLQSSDQNLGNL